MLKTVHRYYFKNSKKMKDVKDRSVHLVVTSPPYPMIEMWDELFSEMNTEIKDALKKNRRMDAFELMNRELDIIWNEVHRVLRPGGFACINIGDATRTIDGHFMLYPNHARILTHMMSLGFTPLPEIVWRKQSNAPNKFMGSGMLPAGAYVTQEHEYILILRKGGKREFDTEMEKDGRRLSAFFWEERNNLFSDVWMDLLGTRQDLSDKEVRKRSAAYPFELPYRLINMYSLKGDTVLDPFFGLGTTMLAAMCSGRNSIGYELSNGFAEYIEERTKNIIEISKERIDTRLTAHMDFAMNRITSGKDIKHINEHYMFPVVTAQETSLLINEPETLEKTGDNSFEVTYSDTAQPHVILKWQDCLNGRKDDPKPKIQEKKTGKKKKPKMPDKQMELF